MIAKDNSHNLAHGIQIGAECRDYLVIIINHQSISLFHIHTKPCYSVHAVKTHILDGVLNITQLYYCRGIKYDVCNVLLYLGREILKFIIFFLFYYFFFHCFVNLDLVS